MPNKTQTIKQKILNSDISIKILPAFSFVIPILILYYIDPRSFEATWKGRTYYLFFIWLILLELILNWETIQIKIHKLNSARFIAYSILLLLPTLYVVIANFFGLNTAIVKMSPEGSWAELIPLSVEYLVFAMLFALTILVACGIKGLKDFSLPPCLIGIIGLIYLIDNLYPYGEFTPFQIFVPTTATFAANVINLMGYSTGIYEIRNSYYGWLHRLIVFLDPKNPLKIVGFDIAWPCAGVDSLILYSVTIFLFLKNSDISLKQKIVYFIIGAVITYFINILRVVTFFVIGRDYGVGSLQWEQFHNYYGALYSITWVVTYPLMLIAAHISWRKIMKRANVVESSTVL